MDFLSELRFSVQKTLSAHLHVDAGRVKVIRRNRNLSQGDFQVPLVTLTGATKRLELSNSGRSENTSGYGEADPSLPFSQSVTGDVHHIESRLRNCLWGHETTETPQWLGLKQCNTGKDRNIYIWLHRKDVFQYVLTHQTRLLPQGNDGSDSGSRVLLNCPFVVGGEDSQRMRVEDLRALLLQAHVEQLLIANRYKTQQLPTSLPKSWLDICQTFEIPHQLDIEPTISQPDMMELKCSKYRVMPEAGADGDGGKPDDDQLYLDLLQYISDTGLPRGKGGYDRNIKQLVLPQRIITGQLSRLQANVIRESEPDRPCQCLHLVSRSGSYHQQQLDLLWQISAAEKQILIPKQLHLAHGGVCEKVFPGGDRSVLFVDDYFSLRKTQMKKAFLLKYGEQVKSAGWENTINRLTTAAIKFELLTNSANSEVKVDMTPVNDNSGEDDLTTRSLGEVSIGVFVMYNYARLATLLDNFEKAVQQGVYPPLPPANEVDFQSLREEDEWALFFNYLLPYRSLIEECVKDLRTAILKPNLHTHKVCQYLHDLCRDLSSYYSKVRVLMENRCHLIPVIHARVILLTAIYNVMRHALSLLNITPLSQL